MTNPEDDPAGFQALRAAYERALLYAALEPVRREAPEPQVLEPDERREPEPDVRGPKRSGEPRSPDWRPPRDAPPEADTPEREHAWRPSTKEARLQAPRQRAWRPPAQPASLEVFDEATRQAFEAARRTLARLVADSTVPTSQRVEALRGLLSSPLIEDVARHGATAAWLASLILANTPRSDCLVDPAIAHFGWDERRVGPANGVGAAVLARREDLRFLAATRSVGNPYQGAFPALATKPAGARLAANRLTPGLARRVAGLLAVVRAERPRLMSSLDPQAVAWWDHYLSRPRLGAISIWLIFTGPPALALLILMEGGAWASAASAGIVYAGALGLAVTGVLVNLFAIEWPRQLWRRRWVRTAPAWVSYGWAPALLGPRCWRRRQRPRPRPRQSCCWRSAPCCCSGRWRSASPTAACSVSHRPRFVGAA